jgi:type I restriction enzyme S subunit
MNTPDLVGEVGYVPVDFNNLFLPDRLWMAKRVSGRDVNMRWLATMLAHSAAGRALKDTATGTSGSMKNISKAALLSLVVPCPEPGEQHAVAAALSDVDAEISALEDKLVKARAVKEGMMQVLLTGEVRLL